MIMTKRNIPVKINLKGGMITANDLLTIAGIAEEAGVNHLQFGSRQQLYIRGNAEQHSSMMAKFAQMNFCVELKEENHPNILSSYVAQDVFQHNSWLGEGLYKDILDSFQYEPRIKINIVDNGQSFAPFFTGNLNFIASPISNYWFLQVRFPKTNISYQWPALVYSFDIHRISKVMEDVIMENGSLYIGQANIHGDRFYETVMSRQNFIMHPIGETLKLPEFMLSYYEGFNQYGNRYWLGIYRRDELFDVAFLKEMCALCLNTKLVQVYITPWKSIIIKNIQQHDRKKWDLLLGKYRINVRHASNELNWQVEDLSEEAIQLKKFLVAHFIKEDLRTFGLCFAIKIRPNTGLFGSVIIRKQLADSKGKRITKERYEILYTRDFNPNSKDLVLFRDGLIRENLVPYLVSLCKYYYERQLEDAEIQHKIFQEKHIGDQQVIKEDKLIYECKSCLGIYDEIYGDVLQGIEQGVSFELLPENYCCGTCGESKFQFSAVIKKPVLLS
jgi:rubredoxin